MKKPPATTAPTQPAQPENTRKRSFAPKVDKQTRLLILGSLPGEKSLELQQYYGNRQNQFWKLMSEVIGEELVSLGFEPRYQTLLRHHIGLWDVVAEAYRPGSLDSNIRNHDHNDLPGLLAAFPKIGAIAFNGGTARKIGLKTLGDLTSRYRIFELPSSSPAYTLSYAEKARQWLALRDYLANQ